MHKYSVYIKKTLVKEGFVDMTKGHQNLKSLVSTLYRPSIFVTIRRSTVTFPIFIIRELTLTTATPGTTPSKNIDLKFTLEFRKKLV